MEQKLPSLSVSHDSHPKLYFFVRHHPEILQLFHNIENDNDLYFGIEMAENSSSDIAKLYIDSLHLPLLIESKAVEKSEETKCGFIPLVSGLEFRHADHSLSAKVAANRASAIARAVSPRDKSGNSLYCYYHGAAEDPAMSAAFIQEIKSVILKYSGNTEKDINADKYQNSKFDFVFSARIHEDSK